MNRHVILSLLSITAANWFGSTPAQLQPDSANARRFAGATSAATA